MGKEEFKPGSVMVNVQFVDELAIGQANGDSVTSTANINTSAKGVRVHQ